MNIYIEIFWRFLNLGLVSFGGPAAHIGYFQQAFVQKYQWLDAPAYGRIVALSQFLPGPGSSQVGFAIGMRKAGVLGGIMAFIGFTLPSFLLLWLLAVVGLQFADTTTFVGVVYGLKLLAVVIVADAVISMAKSFCQHLLHQILALVALALLIISGNIETQLLILLGAAIIGALWPNENQVGAERATDKPKINTLALVLFFALFIGLPLMANTDVWLAMFNDFYQAGSLVFGGGHVVLPLLQHTVGEQMSPDQFLTGYAAAQAVPGPMFALASFLGSQIIVEHSFLAALVATFAIFLPGFLLIVAFEKAWHQLSGNFRISAAMSAVNAVVVGILAAALYHPIAMSSVHSLIDMVIVITGFALFKFFKLPVVALVASFAIVGVILHV